MGNTSFKQIDLLRKRRKDNFLVDPYFIENKKYIKQGIFSGLILIIISLILGIPFILRTSFLENKKEKIRTFSDEYDLLEKKLNKESKELKEISKFNKNLKNSIVNISSSSALLQEISLIIPADIQLLEFISKGDSLNLQAKIFSDKNLETINSFLINLAKSELVKFDDIDLKEIKASSDDTKTNIFLFDLKTQISTEYEDINDKYLVKLGSYGLFNRLQILKKIDESFD